MIRQKKLVLLCITILVLHGKCADKYTDENRPYEFGFSIDGEQHRHEKKDENGIIMGEFGFITADGVYHVTVYATDENGGFKILSMKNIRVKPYPTATSGPEKGRSLEISSAPQTSQKLSTPEQKSSTLQEPQKPGPASPAKSCSHCSLPTTTTTTTTTIKPPTVSSISRELEVPPKYDQNNQNYLSQNKNSQFIPLQQQQTFGNQLNTNPQVNPQHQFGTEQNKPQQNANSQLNQQQPFGNQQNNPQQNANSEINQQQPFGNQQNNPQKNSNSEINPPQPYGNQKSNPQPYVNALNNRQQQFGNQQNVNSQSSTQQQQFGNQQNAGLAQIYPQSNQNIGNNPQQSYIQGGLSNLPNSPSYPQSGALFANQQNGPRGEYPKSETNNKSQDQNLQFGTNRNPKSYGDQSQQQQIPQGTPSNPSGSSKAGQKPQLISAQMQIVDKNTDIHHKHPGEKEGLPEGLNKGDMTNLLYTFNYTVGFHGHFEEGYTNGAKQGYYFVTGRNGVRTRIDYVADDHGFHPKITQEVLDLLSDDVPKPETEKDPKYGLKGYEFKWLYFPVDSNRR